MKKAYTLVALVLLASILQALTPSASSQSQQLPSISLSSQYIIGRYGYAVINETVKFTNNLTSTITLPEFSIGFTQEIAKLISFYNYSSGYTVNVINKTTFNVIPNSISIPPNNTATFVLKAFMPSIISSINNTINVYVMTRPYFSLKLASSKLVIRMPSSTQFTATPKNYGLSYTGINVTYFRTDKNVVLQNASSSIMAIQTSSQMDFHPLVVYSAERKISISVSGQPIITDTITFKNLGVTTLSSLTISPLAQPNSKVTIAASSQPPLLNPVTVSLSGYSISLSQSSVNSAVQPKSNFTITYSYALSTKYYTISGTTVTITIPLTPPIPALVNDYRIIISSQPGVRIVSYSPTELKNASIFTNGQVQYKIDVTLAWSADYVVPLATLVFLISILGFYFVRREEREEKPEDRVSLMIRAFEEKNALIDSVVDELRRGKLEPRKEYFDGLRSRIDELRSKALQRLNEARQSSLTKDLYETINSVYNAEREVERAAKDVINVFEQYYTNRMRKETFESLMPNHIKRLNRSMNTLSDLLNKAQRESKQA